MEIGESSDALWTELARDADSNGWSARQWYEAALARNYPDMAKVEADYRRRRYDEMRRCLPKHLPAWAEYTG